MSGIGSAHLQLRERFADAFSSRYDNMRRTALSRNVPVLPLDTARDVAEQLRELLGYHPGNVRG